jgi:hypothetical protein
MPTGLRPDNKRPMPAVPSAHRGLLLSDIDDFVNGNKIVDGGGSEQVDKMSTAQGQN